MKTWTSYDVPHEGCILKIKCEALRQNNKRKPIHQKLRHEHICWMHCV